MKSLFPFLLLVFPLFAVGQCLNSEKEYKDYFEKNRRSLDPIEGIWSVNYVMTEYQKGAVADRTVKQNDATVYIIKKDEEFVICGIKKPGEERNLSNESRFKKTSISGVYIYNRSFRDKKSGISGTQTANATLTDNILEYSYKYSYELKKIRDWDKFVYTNNQTGVETPQTDADKEQSLQEEDYLMSYKFIRLGPDEASINTTPAGSGTGFALSSSGLIVTNYHVVNGASSIGVKGVNGDFTRQYDAKILTVDKNNDLAIIQITNLFPLTTVGNIPYTISRKTSDVGSSVFVLGYPLRASMGDEIKLTNGIISSKSGYQGDITSYQISVPVQPGNSGGPLFDSRGNLVGIVNAKLAGAENASYAIKTNYLFNLIETLPTVPKLQTVNILSNKSFSEQVKLVKNFTYIIEVK